MLLKMRQKHLNHKKEDETLEILQLEHNTTLMHTFTARWGVESFHKFFPTWNVL